MRADQSSRTLFGVAAGGLGSVFLAAGLVGIRGEIANVNIALALMLVVLGAAAVGGRTAGAMSGVAAATSFDFFHTVPYGSLKIAGANDLVTTLLLVLGGVLMGNAVERSSWFKTRMKDDQRQLHRLHRVAMMAASGVEDEQDLVLSVTAELIDTLHLQHCWFESPPFLTGLPHLESDGTISGASLLHTRGGCELPTGGVDLRVTGGRRTVGRFVLDPAPDTTVSSERLIVAVALAQELGLAFLAAAS